MSVNKSEVRRNKTNAVGKRDKVGILGTPNGHKGRSQKGCFGGKGNIKEGD